MPIVSGRIKKMETYRRKWVAAGLLLGLLAFSGQGWAEEAASSADDGGASVKMLKRARHMEFDERLIMGQSLKSGALYLFERKDSEIQTMLKIRRDYRQELLAPLEPPP